MVKAGCSFGLKHDSKSVLHMLCGQQKEGFAMQSMDRCVHEGVQSGVTCWWSELEALGMTLEPCCRPHRSSTWVLLLPNLSAILSTFSVCRKASKTHLSYHTTS